MLWTVGSEKLSFNTRVNGEETAPKLATQASYAEWMQDAWSRADPEVTVPVRILNAPLYGLTLEVPAQIKRPKPTWLNPTKGSQSLGPIGR